MKPLKLGVGRVCVITMLAIAISLYLGSFVYASSMDNERRSFGSSSSSIFGSSYFNRTMYETQSIINQATIKEDSQDEQDKAVDELQNKVGDDVKKGADTKVTPELKKKSGTSNSETKTLPVANIAVIESTNIGTGTNQQYDNTGRLIAEVFNGVRFIYVGFDSVGTATIQDASAIAHAGDNIIVKGGTYGASYEVSLFKSGVNYYGGYNELGKQDRATPTIITSSVGNFYGMMEIDGFTFNSGFNIYGGSGVTLRNNTFSGYGGLSIGSGSGNGHVTLEGNSFLTANLNIYSPGTQVYARYNSFYNDTGITVSGGASLQSSFNNFIDSYGLGSYGSSLYSNGDYFSNGASHGIYSVGGNLSLMSPGTNPNQGSNSTSGFTLSTTKTITTQNPTLSSIQVTATPLDTKRLTGDSSDNLGLSPLTANAMDPSRLGPIFKGILANKDNLGGMSNPTNPALLERIIDKALDQSALSVPVTEAGDQRAQDMALAMALANTLKNPTEEQKLILDTVQSLVSDMSDITDKGLQAAADKIIEIAANYLLNQALPDLIKAGDVAGVKGIFQDLSNSKTKIMLEYQANTAPYYAELKKMLQDNAEGLANKGILGKTMTQKELDKLPPQEVNKILDMIKRDLNQASYEKDILDYKKKNIEPSKKIMEEKMKEMLERFTRQLSAALEVETK